MRDLRVEKALTQKQLGQKINYSQTIIGEWESGKKQPAAEAIISLAKFFNVTSDYLLGLSDE